MSTVYRCSEHGTTPVSGCLTCEQVAIVAERDRFKAALEFYADHPNMPLANDNGETARKALGRE